MGLAEDVDTNTMVSEIFTSHSPDTGMVDSPQLASHPEVVSNAVPSCPGSEEYFVLILRIKVCDAGAGIWVSNEGDNDG